MSAREARPLNPPPSHPPDGLVPLIAHLPAATTLQRIYQPSWFTQPWSHPYGADTFRYYGPLDRFDHHDARAAPAPDALHGVYYAAFKLWDCAVEVFAPTGQIMLCTHWFTEVSARRDLHLLDLRGNGALRIGSFAALAKSGPRRLTQTWSRYFYRWTRVFAREGQPVDGIMFSSAHNDADNIILYERASDVLTVLKDLPLHDPTLRAILERAAAPIPSLTVVP